MMQSLVQLKQPIHLYLEDTMTEDKTKLYDLSEHQWSVVKSILNFLDGLIRLPQHNLMKVMLTW